MAIRMAKTDVYGGNHPTSYTWLKSIMVDFDTLEALVTVETYVDEAAYSSGKEPFERRVLQIQLDSLINNNVLSHVQTKLLALAEFSGATEV